MFLLHWFLWLIALTATSLYAPCSVDALPGIHNIIVKYNLYMTYQWELVKHKAWYKITIFHRLIPSFTTPNPSPQNWKCKYFYFTSKIEQNTTDVCSTIKQKIRYILAFFYSSKASCVLLKQQTTLKWKYLNFQWFNLESTLIRQHLKKTLAELNKIPLHKINILPIPSKHSWGIYQ